MIPTEGDAAVPGTSALGVPVALTFTGRAAGAATLLPTGAAPITSRPPTTHTAQRWSSPEPRRHCSTPPIRPHRCGGATTFAEHLPLLVATPGVLAADGVEQAGRSYLPCDSESRCRGSAGGLPHQRRVDIRADDYDISVRMLSMLAPHPAIGLTSAVAVAAAATVSASVVAEMRPVPTGSQRLRLGTPAG